MRDTHKQRAARSGLHTVPYPPQDPSYRQVFGTPAQRPRSAEAQPDYWPRDPAAEGGHHDWQVRAQVTCAELGSLFSGNPCQSIYRIHVQQTGCKRRVAELLWSCNAAADDLLVVAGDKTVAGAASSSGGV